MMMHYINCVVENDKVQTDNPFAAELLKFCVHHHEIILSCTVKGFN